MGQEYSSLNIEKRTQLGLLGTQKLSKRQIAAQLGRSASTISREVARNGHPQRGYLAAGAQQAASERWVQAKAGARNLGTRFDTPLGKFVRHELQRALSPEQTAGRLKRMHPEDRTQRVSHETIHQAVYLVPRGELRTELIAQLLTDNGACFTDRFQRKLRIPSGKHHFDVGCRALDIEHRLCPPRHPQTNGLVERFNGRISEIVAQTRLHSAAELKQTLINYVKVYNTHIPQRALDQLTPLDALKSWRAKSPDLFKKRPKDVPGLDI